MLELLDQIMGTCPTGAEYIRYAIAGVIAIMLIKEILYLFTLPFQKEGR